ncbi:MAG: hypothetical protein JEZ02_06975 [Desulfatibacillum sp.]|nr:hypothetical protein [Desulfatibacillum sp.]
MAIDVLFYLGIALLITHELDAIHRHEWRMFPLINRLKEDAAYQTFVVLHIPLFMLVLWFAGHPSQTARFWFQVTMDIFFMVHLGLHLLLRGHGQNEFGNALSKTILVSTALVGGVHLPLIVLQ